MCGISGFVGTGSRRQLEDMTDAVQHRGPDHTGVYMRDGVGFGHARLSIIDTSTGANQPLFGREGGLAIVFNGEIYNFSELRSALEKAGRRFLTASDTEVILALYEREGIACFAKLHGMFAIALYDFDARTLVLARDRMGEKPLYYAYQDRQFVFSSELRGIMASGLVRKEVDLHALDQYLQFDYVPTPHSILQGVHKLEPATALVFKEGAITKETFWHPPQETQQLDAAEATGKLDRTLREVVTRELVADVPLGVFLSGGIDSSAIAYYAQSASNRPVETFSIGFEDSSFDESSFARTVAAHLGTHHHEKTVRAEDALALVPTLGETLSEPMADASVLPTLLLSRFARETVTVALGGDGGDELFAGYPTFQGESLYQVLPSRVRHVFRSVAGRLPASHDNFSFSYNLQKLLSSDEKDTIRRHLEWLGSFDRRARAGLAGPALRAYVGSGAVFADIERALQDFASDDTGNRLLFAYARSYLMDQVLVKVDRASMHYALETRAPFLDHSIVDLAFSLPYSLKYRRGLTKRLLKELMRGKLPDHIIDRKKKGFGIPLARWLNGPLQGLCDDLLSEKALRAHDLFDVQFVHRLIGEHRARVRDNRKELWNLMVFQIWFNRWMA